MTEIEIDNDAELEAAKEQIKQARAELEAKNNATDNQEVAADFEDIPVQKSEDNDLAKQIEDLKKELARRSGEYGSELDRLRKTLQVTAENNAMLTKEFEQSDKKKKKKDKDRTKDPWEIRRERIASKLSDEQKKNYDSESLDVMARVSESAAKEVLKNQASKYIDDRVSEIVKNKYGKHVEEIKNLQRKLDQVEASASTIEFSDVVESLAPGFKKANGTSLIPPEKEWLEFLDSPKDEFMTWRQWCDTVKGPKPAAYAFQQYQARSNPQSSQQPDMVKGQISPAKSQASSPTPSDGQKRTLSLADYQRFQADFYSGKYVNDPQKAVRIMETFTAAAREGRLK